MEMNEHKIYISVYTDEFQKVFEVSDQPSTHIFETEKDKKKKKEAEKANGEIDEHEELKFDGDGDITISSRRNSVRLTTQEDNADGLEESKDRAPIATIPE